MNTSAVVEQLDALLHKKLPQVATKEDIKVTLNEMGTLQNKNIALVKQVDELTWQNLEITYRLKDLKSRGHRNNFVSKGWDVMVR